jgi:hypothetical protein
MMPLALAIDRVIKRAMTEKIGVYVDQNFSANPRLAR